MVKGAITVMPEYNGALLTTSVDPKSTAASTEAVNAELKAKLPSPRGLLPRGSQGAITIIPEYNGALLTTSVNPKSTATSTADVNAELKAKLPSSVEILNSASAQDKDSITVTQATATKYHLTSIADLAP